VPEQVGVDVLGDPRPVAIRLHDLLHPSRREGCATLGLEQIAVLGVGLEVALEHQAKPLGKEDVATRGVSSNGAENWNKAEAVLV
jgi:hypothetical protein